MFKKILSLVLAGLLINLMTAGLAFADSKNEKEARFIEKIKQGVYKLGTGEAARIEVKLRDKTKLKGYISQADDEGFVVVDAKTGNPTKVPYPQVNQVKGNNLSTGAKIAIGVGIGAGVVLIIFFIWLSHAEENS